MFHLATVWLSVYLLSKQLILASCTHALIKHKQNPVALFVYMLVYPAGKSCFLKADHPTYVCRDFSVVPVDMKWWNGCYLTTSLGKKSFLPSEVFKEENMFSLFQVLVLRWQNVVQYCSHSLATFARPAGLSMPPLGQQHNNMHNLKLLWHLTGKKKTSLFWHYLLLSPITLINFSLQN